MPDMIYYNEEYGIGIVIEIDEEIAQENNEPIHYFENKRDYIRNEFFFKEEWSIIRFSEQQIIKNILGSVAIIWNFIKSIDPDYYNTKNWSKDLLDLDTIEELEKVKQLTKNEIIS